MANSCTPPLAYPMAEVSLHQSLPPLQQSQILPTTKIAKPASTRPHDKPYQIGSHSSQPPRNIPHHAMTVTLSPPQPTLAAIVMHQNTAQVVSGLASTQNYHPSSGESTSLTKYNAKWYHRPICKATSQILTSKWSGYSSSGLFSNNLLTLNMPTLPAGVTIHQQWHGGQNCWPPRPQMQHGSFASWCSTCLPSRLPQSPPHTSQASPTPWLILPLAHSMTSQMNKPFSPNSTIISLYHSKHRGSPASYQRQQLDTYSP